MRRLLALLLLTASLGATAVASGCGGSSGSALDTELGYMPKSSPAVVAFKTDPDDQQFKNIGKLIDKFPFAGAIKSRIRQALTFGNSRLDYDKDLKPMLGNDVVVAIQPSTLSTSGNDYVLAWKTSGGDPKKLIGSARKVGSEEGADVYQELGGSFDAIDGDTIVSAATRPLLDTALKTHSSGKGVTEDDFDKGLGDLDKDALVRVEGNIQTILRASPSSAKALTVPYVKALRTFGATASSAADGIAVDFQVKTEGLTAAQQPLATGATPAPVVKRPGEVGVGLRNPAQVANFVEQVVSVTSPKSLLAKDKVSKQLGVDLDKDVIAQLSGNAAASIALDGSVAVRSDLKDAAKFRATLDTIMKNVPKAQRSQGKPPSTIQKKSKGLYRVTKPAGGKPTIIGVLGNQLVIASDMPRAQEIAGESASAEPDTKGALVVATDPKSLVAELLKKTGNSGVTTVVGPALSAHLQALAGSVEAESDGLRGHFKLTVH